MLNTKREKNAHYFNDCYIINRIEKHKESSSITISDDNLKRSSEWALVLISYQTEILDDERRHQELISLQNG
jgi:hypothetical protein